MATELGDFREEVQNANALVVTDFLQKIYNGEQIICNSKGEA